MPVSWVIRDEVLIVTVVRDWNGGGPASAIAQAIQDPQFKPGTALLFDVRQSGMNPSGKEVMSRVEWIASLTSEGLSRRCAAVIGPQPHQFGLARMAQSYLDLLGMELRIFTDLAEALKWLSPATAAEAAVQSR